MFRKMRRIEKAISKDGIDKILETATNGVLSVHGDEDYPYGVPLSFVYYKDAIYFHCATEGHKVDAIKKNPKVSFTVIDADNISPKDFTTFFRSVIMFGKAIILSDKDEIVDSMRVLAQKYSPGLDEAAMKYIKSAASEYITVKIEIDHITGKAGG